MWSPLLLLLVCQLWRADGYKAAVYDYGTVAVPQDDVRNRSAALHRMDSSLDVLEEQARIAKRQGADIFVFPEYGLTGRLVSRLTVSYFVETIPDPSTTTFCPCSLPPEPDQEVLRRLSCAAKSNSLYIAANMGDKQPCLTTDSACPLSGYYQYNTEVVFNSSGCLVARYHKKHLFQSEKLRWDEPKVAEISYFDTDFGRFGLMICFDAVFKSPAADLVEKYNVTDIIFSTAWMNVFPHYISVGYHSGWARTMRVNYLMSNLHHVSGRFLGSGIFSPHGVIDYAYNLTSPYATLVVADVPENPRNVEKAEIIKYVDRPDTSPAANHFTNEVFGDIFTFVPLENRTGFIYVCQESVCCYLDFSRSSTAELYALGVFNGMHYKEGEYYLEICLLVHCKGEDNSGCGVQPADSITKFEYIKLMGAMNTNHSYPQVITPTFDFSEPWAFNDLGREKSITISNNTSVLSVVLMGRNFDKDPNVSNVYNSATYLSVSASLLKVIALCFSLAFAF